MTQTTRNPGQTASIALMATAPATPALASAVEGDFSVNAAALLFVLGVWALLMGLRNLRALRYRPMIPRPPKHDTTEPTADDAD